MTAPLTSKVLNQYWEDLEKINRNNNEAELQKEYNEQLNKADGVYSISEVQQIKEKYDALEKQRSSIKEQLKTLNTGKEAEIIKSYLVPLKGEKLRHKYDQPPFTNPQLIQFYLQNGEIKCELVDNSNR